MENDKEQPKSTFDQIKKIEELKKKQLIAKILTTIRELSKQVLENKELCVLYLQEIENDETEQKRIIDWINNLPDVALDEDKKKELKDKVKQNLKERKKEVQEKIEKEPEKYYAFLNPNPTISSYYTMDTNNTNSLALKKWTAKCRSNDNELWVS